MGYTGHELASTDFKSALGALNNIVVNQEGLGYKKNKAIVPASNEIAEIARIASFSFSHFNVDLMESKYKALNKILNVQSLQSDNSWKL